MEVRLQPTNSYFLVGGGIQLAEFSKLLKTKNKEVTVFAAKRHAEEVLPILKLSLKEYLLRLDIKLISPEDINNDKTFLSKCNSNTIVLGFGETYKFSQQVINDYKFRLLDVMGVPLPKYRGGAHYTWMIMMKNKSTAVHLQQVTTNTVQGEFDDGMLLKSKNYNFSQSAITPNDYFKEAITEVITFLEEFVDEVDSNQVFKLKNINEENSMFMPRLHTLTNGWINWNWSGDEINSFINSFSDPYLGCSTLLNGERVFLKNSSIIDKDLNFHPFQSGLIYRISNDSICIASKGCGLMIKYLGNNLGIIDYNQQLIGKRLYTPIKEMESSMFEQPEYNSGGKT